MTTDNKTLAVDVLTVMLELDDELQSAANYSGEGCYWSVDDDDLLQRSAAARDAVAELIKEAAALRDRLCFYGEWDEGNFYYNGYSASELMGPMDGVASALARVKGESA